MKLNKKFLSTSLLMLVSFLFFSVDIASANTQSGLLDINIGNESFLEGDTTTVKTLLLVAMLSMSSAIVLMFTQFTYVVIVFGMTKQALGATNVPPAQVLVGLALFVSLYMMGPVINEVYDEVWVKWDEGEMETSEAIEKAEPIIKGYMLENTYDKDLAMMINIRGDERPEEIEDVSIMAVVPAFTLTQIQKGLITGMLIYWAFAFIDMIISAVLMYMGMMMLPPTMMSLPFKVLIFVYVGGYSKITEIIFNSVSIP